MVRICDTRHAMMHGGNKQTETHVHTDTCTYRHMYIQKHLHTDTSTSRYWSRLEEKKKQQNRGMWCAMSTQRNRCTDLPKNYLKLLKKKDMLELAMCMRVESCYGCTENKFAISCMHTCRIKERHATAALQVCNMYVNMYTYIHTYTHTHIYMYG